MVLVVVAVVVVGITEALVGVVRSPLSLLMIIVAQRRELEKAGAASVKKLFAFLKTVNWSSETEKITEGLLETTAPPITQAPLNPSPNRPLPPTHSLNQPFSFS